MLNILLLVVVYCCNPVTFNQVVAGSNPARGMRQYQVIQQAIEQFDLRLVHGEGELTAGLKAQVEAAFKRHFGYLPSLSIMMETEIEREKNGKFYSSECAI